MKSRLRSILKNRNTDRALHRKQKADLRQLVSWLVQDSERVIQVRAKSERDVRSFLKPGLADEQLRVGALLQEIFQAAVEVDWGSQKVRRTASPLPPVGVATPYFPLIDRLLIKRVALGASEELNLTLAEADPTKMDDEFWSAFHSLNREQLFESTLECLRSMGRPLTLGELVKALPTTHDLETLAYWLAMARQAGIEVDEKVETFDLSDENVGKTRFHVPLVQLSHDLISELDPGCLE